MPRGALDARLEQRRADGGRVAASAARFSPPAAPMPMSAEPASLMIVRTSAKSRLIEAGHGDQVGDALDALAQHVVGDAERLDDRRAPLDDLEQPVVRDHDQRVDAARAALGCPPRPARRAACPSNANGRVTTPTVSAPSSRAELGDDRRRTGAGAAALAGGDEDHVGALERLLQLVARLLAACEPDRSGRRRRRGRASISRRCGSSRRRRSSGAPGRRCSRR